MSRIANDTATSVIKPYSINTSSVDLAGNTCGQTFTYQFGDISLYLQKNNLDASKCKFAFNGVAGAGERVYISSGTESVVNFDITNAQLDIGVTQPGANISVTVPNTQQSNGAYLANSPYDARPALIVVLIDHKGTSINYSVSHGTWVQINGKKSFVP